MWVLWVKSRNNLRGNQKRFKIWKKALVAVQKRAKEHIIQNGTVDKGRKNPTVTI